MAILLNSLFSSVSIIPPMPIVPSNTRTDNTQYAHSHRPPWSAGRRSHLSPQTRAFFYRRREAISPEVRYSARPGISLMRLTKHHQSAPGQDLILLRINSTDGAARI